ncbi:MAG: hypothetical protein ABJD97_08050 [Betaproteobacteria bacterium]
MDSYFVQAFIWILDHPTPPMIGIVALAWWLTQKRVEHRWARNLERTKTDLSTELEQAKASMQRDHAALVAQHQRELESYKVSLIAEAERMRATQDVAKALALKVAEKRFEALANLHDSLAGLAAGACTVAHKEFDEGGWRMLQQRMVDQLGAFSTAMGRAAPFVPVRLHTAALQLTQKISAIMLIRTTFHSTQRLVDNDQRGLECVSASREVELMLHELLIGYEQMLPATSRHLAPRGDGTALAP